MSENRSEFKPTFERLAKTVGVLLKTAYDGIETLERNISDVLAKQTDNRLLIQYHSLVKAGFGHQEALDAVAGLTKSRLETAIQERRQS